LYLQNWIKMLRLQNTLNFYCSEKKSSLFLAYSEPSINLQELLNLYQSWLKFRHLFHRPNYADLQVHECAGCFLDFLWNSMSTIGAYWDICLSH